MDPDREHEVVEALTSVRAFRSQYLLDRSAAPPSVSMALAVALIMEGKEIFRQIGGDDFATAQMRHAVDNKM